MGRCSILLKEQFGEVSSGSELWHYQHNMQVWRTYVCLPYAPQMSHTKAHVRLCFGLLRIDRKQVNAIKQHETLSADGESFLSVPVSNVPVCVETRTLPERQSLGAGWLILFIVKSYVDHRFCAHLTLSCFLGEKIDFIIWVYAQTTDVQQTHSHPALSHATILFVTLSSITLSGAILS